ncbi:MAG TPA: hypothetical protein VII92_09935, partial [Anaerolineae bacterium]
VYTGTMPFRGGMGGMMGGNFGGGMMGGKSGGGMMGANGLNTPIETAVAQKLGLTAAELNTALQAGQTIDQIAQSKGVSIDDLNKVALAAVKSALADQVKSGAITQQQADSLLSRVTTPLLNFGRGRGFGPGKMGDFHGGMGGFFGNMMGPNGMHQQVVAAIAQKLGLTSDELTKALQSGQTIDQIAQSKGVSLDDLKKVATDAMKVELDALVKQGAITQQQADQMLSQMQNMPMLGFGFNPHGGRGFGRGQGNPPSGQPNGFRMPGVPNGITPGQQG